MSTKQPLIPPSTATHTASPHNNDVLCGRGGTINAHPGNEQYRKFVERKKRVYLTARFKREKRLIASSIVEEIRNLDPPGRFLMKDPHSDIWYDVGDEKARDKTSQALRENALSVRKQMEEEFQETRRQQAREVAIAAGRDPDEAVKNMMSAVTSLGASAKDKIKKPGGKDHVVIPPGQPGQPQPGRRLNHGSGGFVGRSGYGPLYDAQQPAPPQASAPPPPPQGWGYHGAPPPHHGGAPLPASYPPVSHPSPPQGQPGSSPPSHIGSSHYPPQQQYFQPPPPHQAPHGMGGQPHPPHQQQQHQSYYGGHQPPPGHAPPPPQPPHQPPHQYPQYSSWPNAPQPPPSHQLPPPHQQQQAQQSHHTISPPTLAPRRSSMSSAMGHSPPSNGSMSAPPGPPPPHPMIPSTINHQTGPAPAPKPTPIVTGVPPPSTNEQQGLSPLRSSTDGPPPESRHVQFKNAALVNPPPRAMGEDPRRNIEDIPLIISSKKRIQPRSRPRGYSSNRSPDRSSAAHSNEKYEMSPKSQVSHTTHGTHATGATRETHGTHATGATGLTPLTFLSTDMSVKTGDSLNDYLQGIEDEITGDVGQEVELIAHAPVLDSERQSRQPLHHHNYRGGGAGSMYSRSTPPRHHLSGSASGSQKSSGSSRHSRRRKRRSGNHIPSNSGKVQVDWSSAAPAPTAAAPGAGGTKGVSGVGVACGIGAAEAAVVVGSPTPVGSSDVNVSLPCGSGKEVSASCGVILPTPLRSSGGYRSPKSASMAPPSGIPSLPTTPGGGMHSLDASSHSHRGSSSQMAPMSPNAPMSPVHSLDLEKMSLCGTENVSQTGGSIGGASLCNVFDDHDDSVVGPGALMDMTMSIGSGGPTDSSRDGDAAGARPSSATCSSNGSASMGLHPLPLGLNPQGMFNEEERCAVASALMDMSVGSGQNSKANSSSSRSKSSRSKSSSGRDRSRSPASIHKGSLKMGHEHQQFTEESREQPPPPTAAPMPMYAHDFKFTWDGKRIE